MQREQKQEGLLQQPVEAVRRGHVRVNGRWFINFSAANYLGLNQHSLVVQAICRSVSRPGLGTSLAMPRVLATDPLTRRLEVAAARLVGQEATLLFPSTTHIALDILPLLAGADGILFVDEWAYPISLDGAALAKKRGARLIRFSHNRVSELARQLADYPLAVRKVIVCDGVYAAGGGQARLSSLVHLARRFNAVVYVDDAHGLGVLGMKGAGTPVHQQVSPGRHLVHVASLAKAFGASVAFVAGTENLINHLRREAPSLVHSSPPAIPMVAVALAALQVNATSGDRLRGRLRCNVERFRRQLAESGVSLAASSFPIQTLLFKRTDTAVKIAHYLRQRRIWPVLQLHPPDYPDGAVVRFILTAVHSTRDVDTVVAAIMDCLGNGAS